MTFTANLKTLFVSIFSGITTLLLIPTTALAGAFYNGWTYSVDSFNDSVEGDAVGNTVYEIFATAVRQTEQEIIFAINSNLPVSGVNNPYAEDGYTEWGDLLINATGQSLNTASDNSLLFGLHFAPNNGAGVSELGFYGGVRAKSVAQENGLLLSNFAA